MDFLRQDFEHLHQKDEDF
jgi:hypothetical protein